MAITQKTGIRPEIAERLKETDAIIAEALDYLQKNGVQYQLGQWLTIKRYCQKFGITNTNTISNWIARGIIPPENVVELEELNNLKLIKAVPYKE